MVSSYRAACRRERCACGCRRGVGKGCPKTQMIPAGSLYGACQSWFVQIHFGYIIMIYYVAWSGVLAITDHTSPALWMLRNKYHSLGWLVLGESQFVVKKPSTYHQPTCSNKNKNKTRLFALLFICVCARVFITIIGQWSSKARILRCRTIVLPLTRYFDTSIGQSGAVLQGYQFVEPTRVSRTNQGFLLMEL